MEVFHCLEHRSRILKLPAWWLLVASPWHGLLLTIWSSAVFLSPAFILCVSKSPPHPSLLSLPLNWFLRFLTTCIHCLRRDCPHTRIPGDQGHQREMCVHLSLLMHTPELSRKPHTVSIFLPHLLHLLHCGGSSSYLLWLWTYTTFHSPVCLPTFPKAEKVLGT